MSKIEYPPEPQCSDDLLPEDLPDALTAWQFECKEIEIRQLQAELNDAQEIIERVMTQHWDMATCQCWICTAGRGIGFHPREGYPTSPLGTEEFGQVTVERR